MNGQDIIKLKNRNLIYGKVRSISPSSIIIQTDYGEMKIPLEEIIDLKTGPLFFYMNDGRVFSESITGVKIPTIFTPSSNISLNNIVEVRLKKKKWYRLNINTGLSFAKGNSNVQSYTGSAKFTLIKKGFTSSVFFETSYTISSGKTSANYQKSSFNFNWGNKPISIFITGIAMRDNVAQLDLRGTITGGMGYHIFINHLTIFPQAGPSYFHEDYKERPPTKDLRIYAGFTMNYKVEYVEIEATSSWFFSVRDLYDNFSDHNITIRSGLTSYFSLFVSVSDSYNNNPPEGRKHNDLRVTSGIEIKL